MTLFVVQPFLEQFVFFLFEGVWTSIISDERKPLLIFMQFVIDVSRVMALHVSPYVLVVENQIDFAVEQLSPGQLCFLPSFTDLVEVLNRE